MKNMNKKIAIFSDLHLGLKKDSEEWFEHSEKWIDYFIEENKNIDTVFFLGDWFHYWTTINVQTLHVGSKLMKKLSNNFKNVYVLIGNHDCYFKNTCKIHSLESYKEWDNVHVIDTITELNIYGKDIVFIPWGEDLPSKKYDYIFGHFEIINFFFNKGKVCDKGRTSKELLNRANHIFSGHFHLMHEKKFKAGNIIYVGSPFQHDNNDIDNRNGYFVLDMDNDEYEFVENPDGKYPKFIRMGIDDIKNIKKYKNLENSYVTIKIDKKISDSNIQKIKDKILYPLKIKNINFDLKSFDIGVDSEKISDNIDAVDIHTSIKEFVDSMDVKYKNEINELIYTKVKEYEEK